MKIDFFKRIKKFEFTLIRLLEIPLRFDSSDVYTKTILKLAYMRFDVTRIYFFRGMLKYKVCHYLLISFYMYY